MRKIVLLLLIVLAIWVGLNRERVFIRDPMASVYRNDVKQNGVEVYFNFSNDVLIEQSSGDAASRTIVQHWDRVPGTPQTLFCLRWLACITQADHAPVQASSSADKQKPVPLAEMSDRHIAFVDQTGAHMRVEL